MDPLAKAQGFLIFDLGNTNLKMASVVDSKIINHTAIKTSQLDSPKVIAQAIEKLALKQPKSSLICSVVPKLNQILANSIAQNTLSSALFVPEMLPVPLASNYLNPKELGADRLLAAYAASTLYKNYKVKYIVDLGTATTIDCVIDSTFMGGLILPGPVTSLQSLYAHTAKLLNIQFPDQMPSFQLGLSTKSCIEQGIFFGTIAQIEGLVAGLKKIHTGSHIVIGTGGLAKILANYTQVFDTLEDNLILRGLAILSTTLDSK